MRRAVVPGYAYHLTQEGTDGKAVFQEDRDRFVYLRLLRQAGERYGLIFEGYCLMPDRVHLLATPEREDSLHLGMQWTSSAYSRYFHALHNRCGHLWRGRYAACLVAGPQRWRALAYVEMTPVRGQAAEAPEEYAWSSARAHLKGDRPHLRLDTAAWSGEWDFPAWAHMLKSMREDYLFWRELEQSTRTGRPLAPEQTVTWLEHQLGRSLRPLKPGRKPKQRALAQSAPGPAQPGFEFAG